MSIRSIYLARRKMTEKTPDASNFGRDRNGRFLTGNSGGGRPKGSRNKLGEKFIEDAYEEWKNQDRRPSRQWRKPIRRICQSYRRNTASQTRCDNRTRTIRCRTTFAEAFRIARQHIGAEETLQLKAIEHDYSETRD